MAQITPDTLTEKLHPLRMTQTALEAVELLQEELLSNPRLYRDIELFLVKLQRNQHGPLTEFLAALVGHA